MDPVRRAFFLLLFASVLVAEPTQARAVGADRPGLAPVETAQWIRRLAVVLRRTVQPAAPAPSWHRFRPRAPETVPPEPQVAAVHPTREPHAFRLPPPSLLV